MATSLMSTVDRFRLRFQMEGLKRASSALRNSFNQVAKPLVCRRQGGRQEMVDARALIAIARLRQPPQNTTEASRSYAPPFQTTAVCPLVSRLHNQNKPGRGRWDCYRTMHTHKTALRESLHMGQHRRRRGCDPSGSIFARM